MDSYGILNMSKKRTMYGISPKEVRHLLDDCLDKDLRNRPLSTTSSMRDLLKEYLAEKCPTESDGIARTSSTIIDHVQNQILLRTGKSIAEMLSDPQADLVAIREIKEHYKKKSRTTDSKPERHVATAVYFAAVAHALVFHNQKISEYSLDEIHQSLGTIAEKPWITVDLKELYNKALEVCRQDLS